MSEKNDRCLYCGAHFYWLNAGLSLAPRTSGPRDVPPVWGSEFTSKDATLQGGSSRSRCYAERKIVGFGGAW
jgi:hypothetical protein